MTTRRVLPSAKLPDLSSGNPELDRWVQRALQPYVSQVFDQFRVMLATPVFIAPTLLNSWVNYGSGFLDASYYKDPLGRVHLNGLIKSGALNTAFVLPSGYRPSGRIQFMQLAADGTGVVYKAGGIDIQTNGGVVVFDPSSAGIGWISLNGISFAAV